MADTLKFGPEWLRQLSSGGSVTSPPPSPSFGGKYKLAENRYGREEMLALFMPRFKAPEDLKQFSSIYVEHCQEPMAVIPPSEEEQRLLASNVNSHAVVRQVMGGRGNTNDRGPPGMRVGGGRGGMERIRGRGRGRGDSGGFFQRGGYDDEPGASRVEGFRSARGWEDRPTKVIERDSSGFLSARSFDESDKRRGDPFSRSVSGEAWSDMRREKGEDGTSASNDNNEGDWRRAGKERPRGNWREARTFDDEQRYQPPGERGFHRQTSYDRRQNMNNRYSRGDDGYHQSVADDDLPEWAQEDVQGEEGGTFDSSGAFMSLKDVDAPSKDAETNGVTDQKEDEPTNMKQQTEKPSSPTSTDNSNDQKPTAQSKPESPSKDSGPESSTDTPSKTQDQPIADTNATDVPSAQSSADPPLKHTDDTEADFDHLTKAAEQMMATWAAEDEPTTDGADLKLSSLVTPEHADKWFYKDPQDRLQGPFSAQEMAEWFSAGYFTMTLLVKQGSDPVFQPLGELIKRHGGRQPFILPTDVGSNSTLDPISLVQEQQMQLYLLQQQQQQALLQQQQQQALLRQAQLQQLVLTLQSTEKYSKLSPQQINQLAVQFLVKEQQKTLIAQQQQQALLSNSVNANSSPPTQPPEDDSIWGAANRTWKQQMREKQAVDEIAQKEAARMRQQDIEEMERQREYQIQLQQRLEEDQLKREEEAKAELRRQELDRQQELERQRKRQEEIERQRELERQRERERERMQRQRELEAEQFRQQQIYEQKKQIELEASLKRTLESQRQRDLEAQRLEQEKRHKEEETAAEMQRRADIQRQQAEKERLQAMQLPTSAQWAKSNAGNNTSAVPTLHEIQETQREKEERERVEREALVKQAAEQRQRQAEQQAQLKWTPKSNPPNLSKKSLREIQEEEAHQLETEKAKQKSTTPALSVTAAGSWCSKAATGWANEGAWGDSTKKAAILQPSKSKVVSDTFPSLSATAQKQQQSANNTPAKKKTHSKKDEEKVHKMFQPVQKSSDEKFLEWCTKSLNGLDSSIDVPTFVTFLRQIESPYEVQDYVKSYFGESSRSNQFAKDFLEKRSNANKQNKPSHDEEEGLWGPAPAINPLTQRQHSEQQTATSAADKKKKSKKTGKMQKLDAGSLLGFTVGASSNRLNIGQIEKGE